MATDLVTNLVGMPFALTPESPDDIPDPVVPPALVLANEQMIDLTTLQGVIALELGTALQPLQGLVAVEVETAFRQRREQDLSAVTPAFSEEAQIQALSPAGYVVTLITRKTNATDMIEAVGKMEAWLKQAGYQKMVDIPF